MRPIHKRTEPRTVTETREATTTNLARKDTARTAFDQIDKEEARKALVEEQGWLCAFCMRRIDEGDRETSRTTTMKIAHRVPLDVDPRRALDWTNLLGSCDGGERSGGLYCTCDLRQRSTALTVDPAKASSVARLKLERRGKERGLFLTSDDAALKVDVEQTLGLNDGNLSELRQTTWDAFLAAVKRAHPSKHWDHATRISFLEKWRFDGKKLRQFVGVVEQKLQRSA
ncbi:hypothetical protein [Polyangium spumosum]|uniref:TIGR02646 family protein n=1 Tax=Polyangium spumosum TaxID=889282 RepID=A0A6N7Q5K6_9BACT|nr:hypothetical protein [Polyangium spumosum]MRG97564.1 hypothetical protein [Polyangium spumosum]